MGFGGAILRQNAEETVRNNNRRNEGPGFLNRLFPRFGAWIGWDDDDEAMADALDAAATTRAGDDRHWPFHAHETRFDAAVARFNAEFRRKQLEYKPLYTHPRPPADGFTHNFAPPTPALTPPSSVIVLDDEPSASSPTDVNTTLVCANCLDPLVLGGGVTSDQEAKDRKLWGLRCGHLLDGKCIDIVMKKPDIPPPPGMAEKGVEAAAERAEDAEKDAGKSKSKGKGKAVSQLYPWSELGLHVDQAGNLSTVGIRSRLRPRNNSGLVASPSTSTAPSNHADSPDTGTSSASTSSSAQRTAVPPSAHRRLTTLGNGNASSSRSWRKRRERLRRLAAEPRIEERYEWKCPVVNCGRTHVSLKIEGKGWVMDEKEGAIGIFV